MRSETTNVLPGIVQKDPRETIHERRSAPVPLRPSSTRTCVVKSKRNVRTNVTIKPTTASNPPMISAASFDAAARRLRRTPVIIRPVVATVVSRTTHASRNHKRRETRSASRRPSDSPKKPPITTRTRAAVTIGVTTKFCAARTTQYDAGNMA
jgi:hypothetical protein